MDFQNILIRLYQDFNDRKIDSVLAHVHSNVTWPNGWKGGYVHGHEEVRAYWLDQWQEIDPNVVPISFLVKPGGEISVGVHQVIKGLNSQILSDSHIIHTYTFEEGKVSTMIIE